MFNVGENYRVGAVARNIVLFEKYEHRKVEEEKEFEDGEDKAENGWRIMGYYSNVEGALLALLRLEVEKSELKDLQTVIARIKSVEELIRGLNVSDIRAIMKVAKSKKETED